MYEKYLVVIPLENEGVTVIYRGESASCGEVKYLKVEEYLKSLG